MFQINDLFQWDRFITPTIIKTFYWLVIALVILGGISGIFGGLLQMAISPFAGFIMVLMAVVTTLMATPIFERIYGECPYKSPTDMGVNMAGFSIVDDEVCREASRQEVIRRYFQAACRVRQGQNAEDEVAKIELLMRTLDIEPERRAVVPAAMAVAERTGKPALAIELPDGQIVTGRTTELFGAASAAVLNALKAIAGIDDEIKLIAPDVIASIQTLKTDYMKSRNPRLHTDEMLVALAISAASDPNALKAMQALDKLKCCEVHSTVILSSVDDGVFKRLGMRLTCEPVYEKNSLYHK